VNDREPTELENAGKCKKRRPDSIKRGEGFPTGARCLEVPPKNRKRAGDTKLVRGNWWFVHAREKDHGRNPSSKKTGFSALEGGATRRKVPKIRIRGGGQNVFSSDGPDDRGCKTKSEELQPEKQSSTRAGGATNETFS